MTGDSTPKRSCTRSLLSWTVTQQSRNKGIGPPKLVGMKLQVTGPSDHSEFDGRGTRGHENRGPSEWRQH